MEREEQDRVYLGVKLTELEKEYDSLWRCFHRDWRKTPEEMAQTLARIGRECEESDCRLARLQAGTGSPGAAEIAGAQLEYRRKIRQGLKDLAFDSLPAESWREGMWLYAEYAMDLSVYELKQALCATLAAMQVENEAIAERNKEHSENRKEERDR